MLKSIRAKLIASFVVLIILISALSTYSVVNVNSSSQGFTSYQEMAKTSSLASHFQSSIQLAQLNSKEYLLKPIDKSVVEFNKYFDVAVKDIELAKQAVTDESRTVLVAQAEQKLTEFKSEFDLVKQLTEQANQIIRKDMNAVGPLIERLLTDIMNDANRSGNQEIALAAATSIRSVLLGRLYGTMFVESNSRATMNRAVREFRSFSRGVSKLERILTEEKHLEKTKKTKAYVKQYTKGLNQLYKVFKKRATHEQAMIATGYQLLSFADGIKISIQSEQDILGPEVEANNQQIMNMLIIVSLIVVLIAAMIAFTIPRSIINGLQAIQESLANIGRTGDFSIRADETREDEIGKMGQAVNSMLADTQSAIKEANTVLAAIADGRFDQRVKVNLNGDLDLLKQGVNDSAESVSFMMDELGKVMAALEQGDFKVKMSTEVAESFRYQVEGALQSIDATVGDILQVMDNMQQGEFGHRVEVEAKGSLLELKNGINQSMVGLDGAVSDLLNVISAQSQGDLSVQMTNSYQGKLAQLQQAINASTEKLSQVVSGASQATNVVSVGATEVSQGANDLSSAMQQQAAAIEQTSATMDEMNSQVKSNSENAKQVSVVTEEMKLHANGGVEVMQQTISSMNQIQESSQKISEIVSLIDSIAFQTNLLALNAAVEAARAGEHGRGFAVVAGEVRSLAQKSADAAKDIKSLIDETVERVEQGSSLAGESGEMLGKINDSVNSVAHMIESIAKASMEQAEGVNQVFTSISEIDRVTQQNSVLVEQTSAAAQSMTEQAQSLSNEMSFFSAGQELMLPQVEMQSEPKLPPAQVSVRTSVKTEQPLPLEAPKTDKPTQTTSSSDWQEF